MERLLRRDHVRAALLGHDVGRGLGDEALAAASGHLDDHDALAVREGIVDLAEGDGLSFARGLADREVLDEIVERVPPRRHVAGRGHSRLHLVDHGTLLPRASPPGGVLSYTSSG